MSCRIAERGARAAEPSRRRALIFLGAFLALLAVAAGTARASGREPDVVPAPVLGPSGSIMILTAPPGARAWLGERYVGVTPIRVDSLPPGTAEVVVAPPSEAARWRRPRRVLVEVRSDVVDTLRVDLRGAESLPTEISAVPLRSMPQPAHTVLARLETILPAAALGLGVAGAWSRHAADMAYRDYERSLDPSAMQNHYRRAQRLDRISVVCWLGAEVGLAGAAWVWLRGDGTLPIAAAIDASGTVRVGLRAGGGGVTRPERESRR